MNPTAPIILVAFLFAVVTVTTCGGFVNASSASIEFQLGGSIRADMRDSLGQNITLQSKSAMITLIVGHAPTLGFKMEYYASGASVSPDITGAEILTTAKGNLTYPRNGGNYDFYETALFPIAPSVPGQPTLRFTRVDLESDSTCSYDSIRIYTWFDGDYRQASGFCGNTIPTSVTFQDGVLFVLFTSDGSILKTGFDFQYE
ncbi:Exoskeleton protein RP43 [Folsomia candida]|uniref:Exoskeleton protein RP43 n=1 Tax=Folsomia candida TaxID=158441 RepID=A0A226F2M6_FOLCA|nr:Exoskeleton protein RP43 [Folsomia candida]